jgi:uncharacterized protein (DUF302 family)
MSTKIGSDSHRNPSIKTRLPEVEGTIDIPSRYSVDEIVERLKAILQLNGVTLFFVMDHSGEAKKAGMEMPPTKLLIFGNPKLGTQLMLAVPTIAIDLPLKILVWEDAEGMVWLTYNSPEYLQKRHRLPPDLNKAVEVVANFATKATE